jgi:UDP-glucose:(heptosyl)LPS alpha-1,3-glucosyltransferase
VALEALAFGLPVITTVCNGASELMTDGREGFLMSSPDALGELTAALEHMTDDARRKTMSIEAARLAGALTFEHHVEALIKVFHEVAASKSRHGSHGRLAGSRPHGQVAILKKSSNR